MGLLGSVGSIINDVTGVTSSSNRAYEQSKKMAKLSFEQEKYFASHAHQLEKQDLEEAGYNPALTATNSSAGSIASDGGTGNAGYVGTSASITPMSVIDAINVTRQTNADTKLKNEQANTMYTQGLLNTVNSIGKMLENEAFPKKLKAELSLLASQITNNLEQAGYTRQKKFTEIANTDRANYEAESAIYNRNEKQKDWNFYNKTGLKRKEVFRR